MAATENRISEKWFQFDRNFTPLTRKWFYTFILPSNHFRVTRKREREREKERERDSTKERSHQHPAPVKARSIHIQELRWTQKTQDRARSSSNAQIVRLRTHLSDREPRNCQIANPFLRSSSSSVEPIPQIANPEIVKPIRHRSACSGLILLWVDLVSIHLLSLISDFLVVVVAWVVLVLLFSDFRLISDLMNFFFFCWVLRIWVLMNLDFVGVDDMLFGSWENARKCEKHDKIGFFRAFSRIQPNTRKYFSENILECNQTLENIFLSWK